MAPKKKEHSNDLRTPVIQHYQNGDSLSEIAIKTLIFIYNTKVLLLLTFDEQTDKKRYASTANRTHDQDWFT